METWFLRLDALNSIEYQYNTDDITRLESNLYNWMDCKTKRVDIIKAKTIDTNEDVIAVYIYYSKRNSYGRVGSHNTNKAYHLYNGKIYSRIGLIKTIPKEVKMSLKEVGML